MAHPHRKEHQVCRQGLPFRQPDAGGAAVLHHHLGGGGTQPHRHPVGRKLGLDAAGVVLHEEGQQPGHGLHHRNGKPRLGQLLGCLQPDEAATHNHRPLGPGRPGPEGDAVLHGAQAVDALGIGPRDGGDHRLRPGGDHQLVVPLGEDLAGIQVFHLHLLFVPVDADNLVAGVGGDAPLLAEGIRCQGDEVLRLRDKAPHKVGQAAGAVADVAGALVDDDLQLRAEALCLGGGAEPRGGTADDNKGIAHPVSLLT